MAFFSRTHSLYKVKVNNIFSGGYKVITKEPLLWWVPVSSIDRIFDDCIRDLRFNLRLHQKLIDVLV